MPLSKDVLGTAIASAVTALSVDDKTNLNLIWKAIANEVVNHIKTAGVVTIAAGVPVATAGSASAQTGATTAPAIGSIS